MSKINFSELSYKLTKQISEKEKKTNGIYFTPQNIIYLSIEFILNYLKINNIEIKKVLEPSCGSCEYINYIDKSFSNIEITGVELNKTIYNTINKLKFENNVNLINQDYLIYKDDTLFDLIIGNPPYFVLAKKNINKKYIKYFDGRPNIFILFIIQALEQLNKNGILSFVLPKNFLNCLYYNKLRNHIFCNYKILTIIDCSNSEYIDTQQDTIILILQNTKDNNIKFTLHIDDYIIFNTISNIDKIKSLIDNTTTLDKLNFTVSVGNIVWNQHKDILTNDSTKCRLIYNSDIIDNKLIMKEYKNIEKKNFIDKKGNTDLILVINRGYGKGQYLFNYCLIDITKEYLIENHLICIKYKENIENQDLRELYKIIIDSFDNEKTIEFINLYFGNNAINTTELQYILPIFIS